MHPNPPRNFTPDDVARARRNAAAAGRSYIDWSDFEPSPHPATSDTPHATSVPFPAYDQPTSPLTGAKRCQSPPNDAKRCHPHEKCKTNPSANLAHPTPPPVPSESNFQTNPPATPPAPRTRPARPLTPNQLRAARLLLAGHSTAAIAAALHIDRHTLATWKRLPLFQQELRHLLTSSDHPMMT